MNIQKHDVLKTLYTERAALASEIALVLGCATKEVSKHLKELRKDKLIEMDSKGVYRCTTKTEKNIEFLVGQAEAAGKKAVAELAVVAEPAPAEEPEAAANADSAEEKPKMNNLDVALTELERALKNKPAKILDKSLKVAVLGRLSLMLSEDISEVLTAIQSDIMALESAESAEGAA